jgi:3-hydroxybutyryl-CoA dehydrogenase
MSSNIKTIGIAGAGTMGAGIAIVCARAGFRTRLFDLKQDAVDRARQQTEGFLKKSVERGKMAEEKLPQIMSQWMGTTDLADFADCDLVIEAVFEDLAVKHQLFSQLHQVCPPHTLFASNTSTISITEIAGGSGRPDRFVGMHFCLPAQLMKLVEMSPGLETTDETFQAAWALCEALGQKPVKTQDTPGFVLNYFLIPSDWWNKALPRPLTSTWPSRPPWAMPWAPWSCWTWWAWTRKSCCARPCTASPTSLGPRARLWSNA